MVGLLLDTTTLDLATDVNGRLQFGTTDNQNKYLLLKLAKGSIKRLPERCVGVDGYLEAEDTNALLREIRKEFIADGMEVSSIKIENDNLEVIAEYNG